MKNIFPILLTIIITSCNSSIKQGDKFTKSVPSPLCQSVRDKVNIDTRAGFGVVSYSFNSGSKKAQSVIDIASKKLGWQSSGGWKTNESGVYFQTFKDPKIYGRYDGYGNALFAYVNNSEACLLIPSTSMIEDFVAVAVK